VSQENARGESGEGLNLLPDGAASDRPLDGLLPTQAQAATHSEARVVVLGAAGTGKTHVVQARFEWLVAQGCDPERIGVLVPTAARAAALRARIETRLHRGYDELYVLTPAQLAGLVLQAAGAGADPFESVLTPGDRLAMLVERIDELSLRHHDFGGRPNTLLGGFVRRIDRLKAELVTAGAYVTWAQGLADDAPDAELEREFAQIYCTHERMLAEASARDDGDLIVSALDLARAQPNLARRFDYLLLDDAQELDLAPATLAMEVSARRAVTIAGDPDAGLRRYRGAGAARMRSFEDAGHDGVRVIVLERTQRCAGRIWQAATSVLTPDPPPGDPTPVGGSPVDATSGECELWRCATERSQAQSVAVDIERLLARDAVAPGRVVVLVPEITHEGQAVSVALEERAIPHRLIGETAFFQRAEIRDVLAWLRLLADPTDAGAVVRALARPPTELRSVDIARCTQIARRRKLDMVSALAAAIEAPQVPP
jgi:DNA helicase II / ATP-dependent DNA helicase PcrA